MNIGDNIRLRRESRGLTQLELGKQTGLSDVMICYIERGLRVPSLVAAIAIAKALGCTVDDLVSGSATA